LTRAGREVRVIPRDGLRVRFHVIRGDDRLHLELERDGFAREQPVVVSDTLDRIEFVLENRTGDAHETRLALAGLPAGRHVVTINGRQTSTIDGGKDRSVVRMAMPDAETARVSITRER
jgi:hypothetical protein